MVLPLSPTRATAGALLMTPVAAAHADGSADARDPETFDSVVVTATRHASDDELLVQELPYAAVDRAEIVRGPVSLYDRGGGGLDRESHYIHGNATDATFAFRGVPRQTWMDLRYDF